MLRKVFVKKAEPNQDSFFQMTSQGHAELFVDVEDVPPIVVPALLASCKEQTEKALNNARDLYLPIKRTDHWWDTHIVGNTRIWCYYVNVKDLTALAALDKMHRLRDAIEELKKLDLTVAQYNESLHRAFRNNK